MPSKYSHSVVLAQQSSRGLINLPNDQYIDYLRSSPLLTTQPPPRSATAPPTNRSRANSSRADREARNPSQNSLRQQSSFNQLSAGAYQPSHVFAHGRSRRKVLDLDVSSDEDDEKNSELDRHSEASLPSSIAIPLSPNSQYSRKFRFPQKLPIELHQRAMQNGVLTPIPQSPNGMEAKLPARSLPKQATAARPSIELPIQRPGPAEISTAQTRSASANLHRREISVPRSAVTPQLSPTGTDLTQLDDSPRTPFSALRKEITPAVVVDDLRFGLSREDSTRSRETKIFKPLPVEMAMQPDFEEILDDDDLGDTYFKQRKELAQHGVVRLANLQRHDGTNHAKDVLLSTDKASPMKSKAIISPHSSTREASRPSNERADSLSSLSSVSSFGKPSVSQTTKKPKTSAAAMKTTPETPITAHQAILESALPRKLARSVTPQGPKSRFAALSKSSPESQLVTSRDLMSLPAISTDSLKFKQQFDPSLLAHTATGPGSTTTVERKSSLTEILRRISEDEADDADAAAPPPDISRIPPMMRVGADVDPMDELVIDRKGGIMSVRSREMAGVGGGSDRRDARKGRLFRSLRAKGKKW